MWGPVTLCCPLKPLQRATEQAEEEKRDQKQSPWETQVSRGAFKLPKGKPQGFGSSISSPACSPLGFSPATEDKSTDLAQSYFSSVNCTSNGIINVCNIKQSGCFHLLPHTFLYDQLAEVAFLSLYQESTNCNQTENALPFSIKQ